MSIIINPFVSLYLARKRGYYEFKGMGVYTFLKNYINNNNTHLHIKLFVKGYALKNINPRVQNS